MEVIANHSTKRLSDDSEIDCLSDSKLEDDLGSYILMQILQISVDDIV